MDLFSASTYLLLVCKYKQSWDFKLSTFHLENFFLPPPPPFFCLWCASSSSFSSSSFPSLTCVYSYIWSWRKPRVIDCIVESPRLSSAPAVVPRSYSSCLSPLCQSPLSLSLSFILLVRTILFCASLSSAVYYPPRWKKRNVDIGFLLTFAPLLLFPRSHHITSQRATHMLHAPFSIPFSPPILPLQKSVRTTVVVIVVYHYTSTQTHAHTDGGACAVVLPFPSTLKKRLEKREKSRGERECALARSCLLQRQYRLIGQREHKQPRATLLLLLLLIFFLHFLTCASSSHFSCCQLLLLDFNFVLLLKFFCYFLHCFRLRHFLKEEEEEEDDGFRPPPAASPHLSGDGFVRVSCSLNTVSSASLSSQEC